MTIGKRISELRKARGYTQEYIAEQLGVSRQAVSKWESDLSSPDTKNLIALAQLLGTSVEYIAVGETEKTENEIEKQEDKRVRLHNLFVTCATFALFFGIALTVMFPFVGPAVIVVAIIFMILAATLE